MADVRRRNPLDKGGGWFVDSTCIDCDVARQLAPNLIAEDDDGLSYFAKEPSTREETMQAWRALLACPSGSIGAPRGLKPPPEAFPLAVAPDVQLLGYHSPDSFGAHAYLVQDPNGNFLVDAPRYLPPVVRAIEAQGGIKRILLTHRDDVADADRFADQFGAEVWIHRDDADAAPFATHRFDQETEIAPSLRAIPFPGHTRGSALYLWRDRFLFTGDSLAWSRRTGTLSAFRDATWYSWRALTSSMEGLVQRDFEWVIPGHGSWGHDSVEGMRRRLQELVHSMKGGNLAVAW